MAKNVLTNKKTRGLNFYNWNRNTNSNYYRKKLNFTKVNKTTEKLKKSFF